MGLKLPQGAGTRTFSGARAVFSFNGNIFGFASSVSGSEEVMYEPVETLDSLIVREHVPVGYRVTFKAGIFRTVSQGGSADARRNPGSLKELGMMPHLNEILRLVGVDAIIQDRVSGKILWKMRETKTSRNDFNITARGIVAQDVDFVGIVADDESDIAI